MQHSSATLPIILTGDRTTGPLHLGHYVGSLKNRVTLQATHQQYLLLADAQALTDNAHNPGRVRDNVLEIATDYLAVGIDPNVTTICLQSHLPALADLTLLYLNFVTVARLERNPTIKDESTREALAEIFLQDSSAIPSPRPPTSPVSKRQLFRLEKIKLH